MWAKNIVHTCMNITAGEQVLLVTDQPMEHVRERLMAEILTTNPGQVWTYVLSDAERPLREYPPLLHQVAARVDVAMVFYAQVPPEETPGRLAFWRTCRENGTRVGYGAQIGRSILENELSADYQEIATITQRLKQHLQDKE